MFLVPLPDLFDGLTFLWDGKMVDWRSDELSEFMLNNIDQKPFFRIFSRNPSKSPTLENKITSHPKFVRLIYSEEHW